MSAREDILGRVRSALRQPGHPATAGVEVAVEPVEMADVVGLFVERVEDYRAVVVRCRPEEVADRVREGLADSATVVVPEGFPTEWWPDGFEQVADERLTLGLAVLAIAAGVGVDYPADLYGGSTYTSFTNTRVATAAAYRITDRVSVGAALNVMY